MELTGNKQTTVTSDGGEKAPKRILLRSATHLVPGDEFMEKIMFMLDLICQHHWGRDFDRKHDRWSSFGARFGYPNRRCYFLLDHGQSLADEAVPVLWYEWMGESLLPLPLPLPPKVLNKLAEFPFTRPSPKNLPPRPPLDDAARRKSIRLKLRSKCMLNASDLQFIEDRPEEAKWPKKNIEPQFWSEFEAMAEARHAAGSS